MNSENQAVVRYNLKCKLSANRTNGTTGFDFRVKNRVFWGSIGARVRCESPTLPLYYEEKVMKTTFPKIYVCVLRTTKTRHMVSFIDFYFHFPANFLT